MKFRNMRREVVRIVLGLVCLLGGVFSSAGQVKQVQMHIDGYLCGN